MTRNCIAPPRCRGPSMPLRSQHFWRASWGLVYLAVTLGCIALRQIKRRRQDGRELAIVGLTICGLWISPIAAVAIAFVAIYLMRPVTFSTACSSSVRPI
jgi:hypothetical protein